MGGATVTVHTSPDGTLIIEPHGVLDADDAVELRRTLVHAIRHEGPIRLIVDLHDLDDLDAINLGTLRPHATSPTTTMSPSSSITRPPRSPSASPQQASRRTERVAALPKSDPTSVRPIHRSRPQPCTTPREAASASRRANRPRNSARAAGVSRRPHRPHRPPSLMLLWMSSGGLKLVRVDELVELTGDVAFEASHDLLLGQAFLGASLGVGAGARVPAQSAEHDPVESGVGLAVAAVEPVAAGLAG